MGVARTTRFESGAFGCVVHTKGATTCGTAEHSPPYDYFLLQNVLEFFKTRGSPIGVEETFDIIAFIEAAGRSKEQGGAPVETETL